MADVKDRVKGKIDDAADKAKDLTDRAGSAAESAREKSEGCWKRSRFTKKNARSRPSKRPGILIGPPTAKPYCFCSSAGFATLFLVLNQVFSLNLSLRR